MAQVTGWLSATEAARRLGVKPATLYAYVSRGLLSRRTSAAGRSQFDPTEIDRLARRGRGARTPGAAEVVIASRITALGEDRPWYRGRDATVLATTATFEATARWLWTGEDSTVDNERWRADPDAVAVGRAAQAALPAGALPLERLQVGVAALATTDPTRANLDPAAVVALGPTLLAGLVECLPGPAAPARGADLPTRLWSRLAGPRRRGASDPATPALTDALRAAMVLLADHELAASTLAARVAASVRADPYCVVAAGMATLSGPRHGGASLAAEALLDEAGHPDRVAGLVGLRLRQGDRIPGFGHAVYRPADGRATALLAVVRAAAGGHPAVATFDALVAEARRRRLPAPNVDLVLALLTRVGGLPLGAGEAVFALARTAGWLAHALEEYEQPTRLRLRAIYSG